MTLNYINNPVIKTNEVKKLVQTIIEEGIPGKWVVIFTTQSNTKKEYGSTYNKKNVHERRYKNMEWAIHHGDDNYSIICRKKESSVC